MRVFACMFVCEKIGQSGRCVDTHHTHTHTPS